MTKHRIKKLRMKHHWIGRDLTGILDEETIGAYIQRGKYSGQYLIGIKFRGKKEFYTLATEKKHTRNKILVGKLLPLPTQTYYPSMKVNSVKLFN
jgi:hypothetical protein